MKHSSLNYKKACCQQKWSSLWCFLYPVLSQNPKRRGI